MFDLNYQEESEKISAWIKETVSNAGFSKVVVAVSGGIDSAVSASLAVNALGRENVYCVLMPYGKLSDIHTQDGLEILKFLEIPQENILQIDIQNSVDAILENIENTNDIRKGNIMARVRMIYLFDSAKKLQALVCGTENKTENYLGYFTRFGDEASDLEPIKKYYKTQVWELGKYLNIPEKIIAKQPTAGLWEEQTDEGELGFTYKEADSVLFYRFDKKLTVPQIIEKGISQETITKVLQYVRKNAFKHNLPHEYS